MKKKFDILQKKRAELKVFTEQYDAAVAYITGTITNLESVNQSIEEKINEINEYEKSLDEEKRQFGVARQKNENVLKNLKALIGE